MACSPTTLFKGALRTIAEHPRSVIATLAFVAVLFLNLPLALAAVLAAGNVLIYTTYINEADVDCNPQGAAFAPWLERIRKSFFLFAFLMSAAFTIFMFGYADDITTAHPAYDMLTAYPLGTALFYGNLMMLAFSMGAMLLAMILDLLLIGGLYLCAKGRIRT